MAILISFGSHSFRLGFLLLQLDLAEAAELVMSEALFKKVSIDRLRRRRPLAGSDDQSDNWLG